MELFDVFNEFENDTEMDEMEESDIESFHEDVIEEEDNCKHKEISNDNGIVSCLNCGMEVSKIVSYEKDWRYYGNDDTRKNSDPNRCHIRKIEDKSIFRDVENLGFSEKVVNLANDIYTQVTKGKIYRGNSRKSIIFGCIFHSVKMNGKIYSCEALRNIFKLDKKIILKGLKHVNLHSPKNGQIINRYITPIELVNEYIVKFPHIEEDKKAISDVYERIKNKSSMINRSRPQSVASSLIYYHFAKKHGANNFSIKDFIKKIKLSELTVNKISKEITRILSL
jgi:transcription initiation factor TFIIIB Brf1 subunit/transcription initiation factor TFIIB